MNKSKTNITAKKLNELGFSKISPNEPRCAFPVYYAHFDIEAYFIGQSENNEWGIYKWGPMGECVELVRELPSMSSIISYIIEKSIEVGRALKASEIRKVINGN